MSEKEIACWVYRSSRKEEMYLYISRQDDFTNVPNALLKKFGVPVMVMELILNKQRKLAREDVSVVMKNLSAQGFHLQMPPKMQVELYSGD
ncbi:MAG: YcgL domain-containing protein [Candidatus Thiodiazotropha sp.]